MGYFMKEIHTSWLYKLLVGAEKLSLFLAARIAQFVLSLKPHLLQGMKVAQCNFWSQKLLLTFWALHSLEKRPNSPKYVFPLYGLGKKVKIADEVEVLFRAMSCYQSSMSIEVDLGLRTEIEMHKLWGVKLLTVGTQRNCIASIFRNIKEAYVIVATTGAINICSITVWVNFFYLIVYSLLPQILVSFSIVALISHNI